MKLKGIIVIVMGIFVGLMFTYPIVSNAVIATKSEKVTIVDKTLATTSTGGRVGGTGGRLSKDLMLVLDNGTTTYTRRLGEFPIVYEQYVGEDRSKSEMMSMAYTYTPNGTIIENPHYKNLPKALGMLGFVAIIINSLFILGGVAALTGLIDD